MGYYISKGYIMLWPHLFCVSIEENVTTVCYGQWLGFSPWSGGDFVSVEKT